MLFMRHEVIEGPILQEKTKFTLNCKGCRATYPADYSKFPKLTIVRAILDEVFRKIEIDKSTFMTC
jgi:hypothetical protein